MNVIALKSFISTRHGNIEEGDIIPDCDPKMAAQWASCGMVKPYNGTYNTKVVREEPETPRALQDVPLESGEDSESSSAPAAPASPKKTRKSSKAKESSPSTPQSE